MFNLPACNVSEEQQLLQEYEQERLADALRGIYTDFYVLIELMRGYAQMNDDEDYIYYLLAEKLRQPLDRLNRPCTATVDWQLVRQKSLALKHKPGLCNFKNGPGRTACRPAGAVLCAVAGPPP